jgi:hypothetical protein
MPSLLDPNLEKSLAKDVELLQQTKLPIVTVSASFKEDLKNFHGFGQDDLLPDVVFSRAHYSMTAGLVVQAWGDKIDPTKAWVVDPTNYVAHQDWQQIQLTELIGKTLARHTLLKKLKDLVDHFGRKKLPILKSITPPLLYLFQHIDKPILSLHIAAGNILAKQGKTIIQVVTDPHVRDEYLDNIERPNFTLCVFDEKTKTDALEKGAILGKTIDPNKIIVTGPPVDPRIVACRHRKNPWRSGQLNLCLTTGGLGTNKSEMRKVIRQLLPYLRKADPRYRLMIYAGTQTDIFEMVKKLAKEERVALTTITNTQQSKQLLNAKNGKQPKLFVLYHPQIVDANELLIRFGFPWADGFITKPSGDMAYDAAASGSFILTLQEWGIWEHNISELFEQRGIARKANVDHFIEQLEVLTDTSRSSESWVEKAMIQAQKLPSQFLSGNENIIKVVKKTSTRNSERR